MVQGLHLHYCICIGMVCSLKIVLYGRRPCPKIIIVAVRVYGKKALDENSELPVSTVHWYNCRGSRQGPEHQQLLGVVGLFQYRDADEDPAP